MSSRLDENYQYAFMLIIWKEKRLNGTESVKNPYGIFLELLHNRQISNHFRVIAQPPSFYYISKNVEVNKDQIRRGQLSLVMGFFFPLSAQEFSTK